MATRYNSYDSRSSTSSYFSDPSSSAELKTTKPHNPSSISRALVNTKPSVNKNQNLTTLVKNLMVQKKSSSSSSSKGNRTMGLVIPADVIAEDLKKTARKGGNFAGLQRKLFGKGEKKSEVKALTEVKGENNNANTRTLAMVLRSERELLNANKEQEMEISQLKSLLEEKNNEVEKLKDLCLNQREEIKALKSAILFPDAMNSQLQELIEKQGSELKQAKQVIPSLQRQVTSLTDQLQFLAEGLAEVKAEKCSTRTGLQLHGSGPRTPAYDYEEAANSLEFSSEAATTPGSPDDMFLKDLNPCLTPYCTKTKSKEFEAMGYDSLEDESISENKMQVSSEIGFNSHHRKLSKSSDYCQSSNTGSRVARTARKSDESKRPYGRKVLPKGF
ncbi:uncharacterized protein LOC123207636 [Mangifera indica]|uniref:uncharacterized protein LOC123207636 n=1 Tax=Mangifera indica TaxID=29780 RepID=UPI001CFBF305|nr:uncharacterized protein LOC123207636 [Mangifera indica]